MRLSADAAIVEALSEFADANVVALALWRPSA